MSPRIADTFAAAVDAHRATLERSAGAIQRAADEMHGALGHGGKILVFGNGGSAADAQHFAAELVNRFQIERAPFAAIALTTDTSILTSIANDSSYDRVFARQIEALGRAGDVALGISTSGTSANILAAFAQAKRQQIRTIALAGDKPVEADVTIGVAGGVTARIQEVHRTVLHILCDLIESPEP